MGRGRPRTIRSQAVENDMKDLGECMHKSARNGGNCCGEPLANPCTSRENGHKMFVKTNIHLLVLRIYN